MSKQTTGREIKEDSIVQSNRLIAEFDGWRQEGNRFVKSGSYMAEDGEHEWERSVKEAEFSYHKNWSLLMPVIEKIAAAHGENLMGAMKRLREFAHTFENITDVFKATVEYINWHKNS